MFQPDGVFGACTHKARCALQGESVSTYLGHDIVVDQDRERLGSEVEATEVEDGLGVLGRQTTGDWSLAYGSHGS